MALGFPGRCFCIRSFMMKSRIFSVLIFLFLAISVQLHAQTAAEIDALLEADKISAACLARFVLGAADLLPEGLSGAEAEEAAYGIAYSNGWLKLSAGENVTLKDTAFLIMKAFDLRGGIMYSLFKNPRYAYREMIYRKLIMGHADQAMTPNGARLLQILDKTISYTGVEEGR